MAFSQLFVGPAIGSVAAEGDGFIDDLIYTSAAGALRLDYQTGALVDESGRRFLAVTLPNGTATVIQAAAATVEDQTYQITAFNRAGGTVAGSWVVSTFGGLVTIAQLFATDLALTNDGLKLLLTNSSGASIDADVTIGQGRRFGRPDLMLGAGQMDSMTGWALGENLVMDNGVITASSGSGARVAQYTMPIPLAAGDYRITFEIKTYSAGLVIPRIGALAGASRGAVGVFSEIINIASGAAATVGLQFNTSCVATVDNLVVTKIS